MPTLEQAEQASLSRRSKGWIVQCIRDVPVPESLPYAGYAQAWTVAVMRQYNELGDEPEWLKGCDQETHLLYYEQMGDLAKTSTQLEVDLVIYWDGQFFVTPCTPGTATAEHGGVEVKFLVAFPKKLEGLCHD